LTILADFLLIVKEIIPYTKKDIDKGFTPLEIYQLCNCIKETFCLSYAIRKMNNLYMFFLENAFLVKFVGNELRFVGSDERSQAILLSKALNLRNTNFPYQPNQWKKSTPGIYVMSLSNNFKFMDFLLTLDNKFIILILDRKFRDLEIKELDFDSNIMPKNATGALLLIPIHINQENEELMKSLMNNQHIIKRSISPIRSVSDIILYMNYQWDLREEKIRNQ